ncbi:putative metacaspase 5 [Trypanosoma cruzi]|uniref:Putative metacaspase 5 n=1 Tax=Trypanosoma cruzi TaxID=5693 RepID=A0A2V2VG19_TRYCR|nr:putative metacaspase 5 [Trypanosoma cruzi]
MDLLLGVLSSGILQNALPFVAGVGRVKRPKRVKLEEAFREATLVPSGHSLQGPTPYTGGRVKALFVGINYTGTRNKLSGCVKRCPTNAWNAAADPVSHFGVLVFWWMTMRFPNFTALPTRENIIKHMAWLVHDVRPGDVLFFHYSGHGQRPRRSATRRSLYDQCLVPLDYQVQGAILDDDLFELLVKGLPAGVRMTAVLTVVTPASLLDLPFAFVGNNNFYSGGGTKCGRCEPTIFPWAMWWFLGGCDDSGTSADVSNVSSFGSGLVASGGAANTGSHLGVGEHIPT